MHAIPWEAAPVIHYQVLWTHSYLYAHTNAMLSCNV